MSRGTPMKGIIKDLIFQVSVVIMFISIGVMAEEKSILSVFAVIISAMIAWICLDKKNISRLKW